MVVTFYIAAALLIVSALAVITRRNPMHSALSLVLALVSLAVIFVTLEGHFVAVIQILIYAGAVVVLFVFIVMLLNLPESALPRERMNFTKLFGIAAVFFLVWKLVQAANQRAVELPILNDPQWGGIEGVGRLLFTDYVLIFELVSVLLLGAIVGVIALVKQNAK